METERQQIQKERNTVRDLIALDSQPGLAAQSTFIHALYNRSRDWCLRYCYLATRAYHFWTLKPNSDLFENVKLGDPGQITHTLLSGVLNELYNNHTTEITGDLGDKKLVQHIPGERPDGNTTGVLFLLKPETHKDVFSDLKTKGVANFRIPVPEVGKENPSDPFVNYSNVRLTRMRVWLRGIKIDGNHLCTIQISHQVPDPGLAKPLIQESIRKDNGEVVSFRHEPVDFLFQYNWTKAKWDEEEDRIINPGDCLADRGIDGAFDLKGSYKDSKYGPLVGPFTNWEIAILGDRSKIDLSGVSVICIDCHAYIQGVKKRKPQ